MDRRHLLGRLGWLAAGSAVSTLAGHSTARAVARRASAPAPSVFQAPHWAPDPARRWRGYSSIGLERLAGIDHTPPASARARLDEVFPWRPIAEYLRSTFPDLHRHFVFEYYPWYGTSPWRHWEQWDRIPPIDVAATSMPRLGPYDSRDTKVIEQHARWIRETGAGAINLSWWGQGSYEDRVTHRIMDVMHDHDLKVAFHIEPYADDRSRRYVDDLLYILREYGEKRSWDAFLILTNANGRKGPVFKSFRTILPELVTDCHGVTRAVSDYTPDDVWAAQTDGARRQLFGEFDHIVLLADALNMNRTRNGGFDGVAVYDNYVAADTFQTHAERATDRGLVFSFNCNPGFDGIARRNVAPGSCYVPPEFYPEAEALDFSRAEDRETARRLSQRQIRHSFKATLLAQADPALLSRGAGFFLVYINSFNEWHEGHAFEPAASWRDLTPAQQAFGYHNPRRGQYRHATLRRLLRRILSA